MKKIRVIDAVLFVLALVLCLGTAFAFHACGPRADGSWMTCHWAEHAVILLGALASALCAIKMFAADGGIKWGLGTAAFLTALCVIVVPGRLIPLCRMADMRCRLVMLPSVLSLAILFAALSLVDLILLFKSARKDVSEK